VGLGVTKLVFLDPLGALVRGEGARLSFVDLEERPGMVLQFHEWDLEARLDDDLFRFEAPEGAREIELMPLSELDEEPARRAARK